jgi:uncharacterized protein (TIGR03435 family)
LPGPHGYSPISSPTIGLPTVARDDVTCGRLERQESDTGFRQEETTLNIGLALVSLLIPVLVNAQSQPIESARSQFEVVSVKPHASQSDPSKISSDNPGRFVVTNVPLWFLILYAYEIPEYQLIGAPDWTSDSDFDIIGTYSSGQVPTDREKRLMLQNLLTERFNLKMHREKRELPTYDLVLARKDGRLGPQLTPSTVDCAKWNEENRPKTDAGAPGSGSPSVKRPVCRMIATRTYLTGGARSMEDIASTLHAMVARPVTDRTDMKGVFDVDLRWSRFDLNAESGSGASPNEGPSIFTAVQEQLGLKLVPRREKFEVFVIDDVKPPIPN